jgi:3',5'-cyclic AMP phosphodiesterase CpdA
MSRHQFVQFGDAHFGPHGGRNADRYAALDQIIAEGSALPYLAAWLGPGDLYHQRSEATDRDALSDRIVRMANRAPVVLCPGNHEAPLELRVFAKLGAAFPVYLAERPAVLSVRLATTAMAAIAVLPYPCRAGLIAAGAAASQTLDAAREALAVVVQGLAAELEAARARGDLTLTIGHVNVGGAIASVGQPQIGREIELDPLMVARLVALGYVGLNHIHKPQQIHGAYYAGSIAPMDWGEMEAKRYLVITYEDGAPPVVDSRPLASPPMVHIEGELTRDGFAWKVTKGIGGETANAPETYVGADVRVRYTFRAAERDVLDLSLVRAPFEGARFLKTDPVPITDRAIRAPLVVAAKTLPDKVRAYCAEQGLALTEGLLTKLDALQAPAPTTGELPLEPTS